MGYKKYSDSASAERMIELIENGEVSGNTAYRELQIISEEWAGTPIGNKAEYMKDDYK